MPLLLYIPQGANIVRLTLESDRDRWQLAPSNSVGEDSGFISFPTIKMRQIAGFSTKEDPFLCNLWNCCLEGFCDRIAAKGCCISWLSKGGP